MTALSTPRKNVPTIPHGLVRTWQKLVKSGEKIWEGAVVALDPTTGKWVEASANPTLEVHGIARCPEYFDNTDGTNTKELLVDSGCFLLFSTGLTDADEGKKAYVTDDQTFTLTPSALRPVMGKIVQVRSATEAFVYIEPPSAHDGAGDDGEVLVPGADLTNADATITVAEGGWRKLPAATLSAAHTLTLDDEDAVAGDRIKITREDVTGFAYTIVNGGGGAGTLAVLPGGQKASAEFVFDGTDWKLMLVGSLAEDIAIGSALSDSASQTIQRQGRRSWFVWSTTVSADSTVTLGTTGAQKGDTVLVTRTDSASAHTIAIVNGGGGAGTLFTMPNSKKNFAECYFDGTNWSLMRGGAQ